MRNKFLFWNGLNFLKTKFVKLLHYDVADENVSTETDKIKYLNKWLITGPDIVPLNNHSRKTRNMAFPGSV